MGRPVSKKVLKTKKSPAKPQPKAKAVKRSPSTKSKSAATQVDVKAPLQRRVVLPKLKPLTRSPAAAKARPAAAAVPAVNTAPVATSRAERKQAWAMPSELPANYGDNVIYLLVRDPYWLYAYWEIQKDHQERTLSTLKAGWEDVRSILRIYNTTEKAGKPSFFDIELQGLAINWFIHVEPNHSYVVEIGLLHRDGRFAVLARSNEVVTPRATVSEIIDEQWMGLDFEKVFALSGGMEVGKSSQELRELMEKNLLSNISSGSGAGLVSSLSSPVKGKQRGFWFVLDCEVIVYGATEPDAQVTFQGRSVKLRPDGTFSFRFALPDGKFIFDARAVSADGVEERAIIPTVERTTQRPAPVLKAEEKV